MSWQLSGFGDEIDADPRVQVAVLQAGYYPLLAVAAGTGDVLMARLREGRANTVRGAAHFLESARIVRAPLVPAYRTRPIGLRMRARHVGQLGSAAA